MRVARWCFPAVIVIAGVLIAPPLRAQNSTGAGGVTEAVDFVSKLPALFRSWVDQFDRIAESEQRRQFVRKVDRLRKGLYKLEVDKEFLLESIPDRDPDVTLIHQNVADLEATLTGLRETLREIGADVRAERGAEVEAILRSSLSTRTKGLAEVADAVQRADYDPVPIREALLRSLTSVRDAQVAVTDFYERLNASP